MRIIGGTLKGKAIMPPTGYKARPTTDFAKEGLFNILCNEFCFDDISVLDFFGGTGSISFEFASRGCTDVICVEMNQVNANFIKKSAISLGLQNSIQVVHHNVFDFIPLCTRTFDIVFADPPYAIDGLDTIPDKVINKNMINDGGYLILEHPADYDFSSHPNFKKEKKYGNVHFSFFSKKS